MLVGQTYHETFTTFIPVSHTKYHCKNVTIRILVVHNKTAIFDQKEIIQDTHSGK